MRVNAICLDIAENVFQVRAADEKGRMVLRTGLRRAQLAEFVPTFRSGLWGLRPVAENIIGRGC